MSQIKYFLVNLIETGPLLGDIAKLKALLNIFGIFFTFVMVHVFFSYWFE